MTGVKHEPIATHKQQIGKSMTNFRVEVTANTPPSVCVDFEQEHEPTDEEIEHAVNELASEVLSLDGYLAEHCVESGYIVTNIERYP